MLTSSCIVRRIRRRFYLKYPYQSITDENLPEITSGYKKRVCQNEKYHQGRVWETMTYRQENRAETKCFTVGSNKYGQCGILGKNADVRQIPVDNIHSGNFHKNQEKLQQLDHKWNKKFKSVLVNDPPEIVEHWTNPLGINRFGAKKIKITNVAAGRQTTLILGKQEVGRREKWVLLASGVNEYGQLGCHLTPTNPIDTDGKEIIEQFDEKGNRVWSKDQAMKNEMVEEKLLAAFRRIPFRRDCGIPHYYRPLSVSSGGAHSTVVFGHVDYDPAASPQENLSRAAEFPNFVMTMGNNDFGQCGVSEQQHDTYNIVDDQNYLDGDRSRLWHPFKTVCGESHTLFLSRRIGMKPTRGWRVFATGLNESGQLGLGDFVSRFSPEEIPRLPPLTHLSSKSDFCLGLDIYDQIWGWGSNVDGVFASFTDELALGRPVLLSTKRFNSYLDGTPVMVAAGSKAGIILTATGSVYTFGTGLLGFNGEPESVQSGFPIPVEREFFGGSKPTAVFAGHDVFAVITDVGELYTWGHAAASSTVGLYEEPSKVVQPFPWRSSNGLTFRNVLDVDVGVDHFVTLAAI